MDKDICSDFHLINHIAKVTYVFIMRTCFTVINSFAIIIFLPEMQSETRGSKIGIMKINSYKSNAFPKSKYHIFAIMISSGSYALIKTSLPATTWSD